MDDNQPRKSTIIGQGRHGLVIAQPTAQQLSSKDKEPSRSGSQGQGLQFGSSGGRPGWYAVKVVSAPPNGRSRHMAPHDILKEAKILQRLDHPSITKVLAYEYDTPLLDHKLYMPLYVCSLSSLFADPSFPFLSSRRSVPESLSYQLLSSLSFLHSKQIAHRDINPSNLVLDIHGNLKLIDFGTTWVPSRIYQEYDLVHEDDPEETEEAMCPVVGSGAYRAPELLFSPLRYDPYAVDMWSAGCIIAQFFRPFSHSYHAAVEEENEEEGEDSEEDYDPLDDERPSSPAGSGTRQPLFDARFGALGLAASIFRIRGTPTEDTWPTFRELPDAEKIEFPLSSPQVLAVDLLPDIESLGEAESKALVDVLEGMLALDPGKRLKAEQALGSEWFRLASTRWEEGHLQAGEKMEWYDGPCVDWVSRDQN
ncbi:hypothetical protein B9479_000436 [Cryptococcus floricola]|uniref:Protein kinase domain-containing protein n=1 Tax=Cryptococcus floricola TaxID=2591691 RepID=A0A5D3B5X6_9TREE|nr:hypothetical protein B9479_000436 [Cryptococcus floricola]